MTEKELRLLSPSELARYELRLFQNIENHKNRDRSKDKEDNHKPKLFVYEPFLPKFTILKSDEIANKE